MSLLASEPGASVKTRASKRLREKHPKTITKLNETISVGNIPTSAIKLENISIESGFLRAEPEPVFPFNEIVDVTESIGNSELRKGVVVKPKSRQPPQLKKRTRWTRTKCRRQCDKCGESIKTKLGLLEHNLAMHPTSKTTHPLHIELPTPKLINPIARTVETCEKDPLALDPERDEEYFQCPDCKHRSTTLEQLKTHKICKHPDYKCNICGLKFAMSATYEHHLELHAKSEPTEEIDEELRNSKPIYVSTTSGILYQVTFRCEICQLSFPTQAKLSVHKFYNHNTNNYNKPPPAPIREQRKKSENHNNTTLNHSNDTQPGFCDMIEIKEEVYD